MTKAEMKDLLFEMLGGILDGSQFRLRKRDNAFVRNIHGGWQRLGLPLYDYNPEYVFSLTICIRLDPAEDIFHMFSRTETKYRSMSFTTNTRLERFSGGTGEYKAITAGDVASAESVLSRIIRGKIAPFFDEHQDVEALDRAVNSQEPGIDDTQYPWKAMHPVILAHLAGNKDFERLVAKHRREMQLAPEADHEFNRLVDYLRQK